MSTLIELKPPYSNEFKCGYLNINKEPRRVLLLIKENGDKTSTSYARYLMACSLGRYLDKDEHVDHVDNDKMNDTIGNLQIMSCTENNKKERELKGVKRTYITLVCPICNKEFTRDGRNIKNKINAGKTPTCSRSCGGKMSNITRKASSDG